MLTGGLCSIGIAITHVLRYIYVVKDCNANISTEFYVIFEIITYVILDVLRVVSYCIFIKDAWRFFIGFGDSLSWYWPIIFWPLTLVLSLAILVPTSTVGQLRDAKYTNSCNTSTEDVWRLVIIDAHAVVKSFVYLSTLVVSSYASVLICSSICKWKKACRNIKNIENEWSGNKEHLRERVHDKFYHLHNDYIKVGKDTSLERNALKRWFLLMYVIYFAFVVVNLVHITRILSKGVQKKNLDIIHAPLNTFIFLAAFLVPYYLATWLNSAHHNYYKEMIEVYLKIEIALGDKVFLCNPGKEFYIQQKCGDESIGLVQIQDQNKWVPLEADHSDGVEKLYKQYYREALITPGDIILTKKEEFEFVPSFLIVTIPIDSSGYALTILISVFSVILSFV